MPFCKQPHTHITHVPGSELSLCFQDSVAWDLGCDSPRERLHVKRTSDKNLHLNSWTMGVQEEEKLVERGIAMDEVRMRDSRDRLVVLVERCISVNREVNIAYYGG